MSIRDLSIKKKIIGGIVITVLISAFVVLTSVYLFMRATLISRFNEQTATAGQTLMETYEVIKQKVRIYADILSRRQDIVDAILKKDIELLEKTLTAEYKKIHELDSTIMSLEVTDDRGIIIMRGHNPSKRGDDKSKVNTVKSALSGEASTGLEVSPTSKELTYESVYPLKSGSRIVGTIKVGSYFRESTANYMKNIANVDVIFFSGNKVNVSTIKELSNLTLNDEMLSKLKNTKTLNDVIKINGKSYNITYFPAIDQEGNIKGVIAGVISMKALEDSLLKLYITLIITFGVTILLTIPIIIIANRIVKRILLIVEGIEKVSEGDLTVSIPQYKDRDEIGLLIIKINKMIESFRRIIDNLLNISNIVVSSVDTIRLRAQKTAEEARNQSEQADLIVTAVEQMNQTIGDIAKNASFATETSEDAMKTANQGKGIAEVGIKAVNDFYKSTLELASMIKKLNNRASEIGQIVTVIKDIADQTNLLALNAAIVAARAGEQGRGFAVVADEVRKLAERTIKATAEISEKIAAVQSESTQTTKSMEEASREVTKATDYIKQVGHSLNQIVESVHKVRDQIMQIATAVEEQSSSTSEVTKNIEKSQSISKEVEKMAVETSHEVNSLVKIAEKLRDSTAGFKTKES